MKMPLYPTEDLIWDPNLVPEEHYSGQRPCRGELPEPPDLDR